MPAGLTRREDVEGRDFADLRRVFVLVVGGADVGETDHVFVVDGDESALSGPRGPAEPSRSTVLCGRPQSAGREQDAATVLDIGLPAQDVHFRDLRYVIEHDRSVNGREDRHPGRRQVGHRGSRC